MRSNKKSILGVDCLLSETETREVYRRLYSRGKTKQTDSELLYLAVSEGSLGRVQLSSCPKLPS